MPGRTYTDEEVREILRRAVDKSNVGGGLSRDELVDAARDVGIEPAAVNAAIEAVELDREVTEELTELQNAERRKLTSSFLTWGIISAGLLAMRWFGEGGWWFLWPMGIWAVILLLRLKGTLLDHPEGDRARAERNVEQRRRKQRRAPQQPEQAPEARMRVTDDTENSGEEAYVEEPGVEAATRSERSDAEPGRDGERGRSRS